MSAQMLEVSLLGVKNGSPPRQGCVAIGQMTKASNKRVPTLPSICKKVRLTSGS